MTALSFKINGFIVNFHEDDEVVIQKLTQDDTFTLEFFTNAVNEGRLTQFGLFPYHVDDGLSIERVSEDIDIAEHIIDHVEYGNSSLVWITRRPTEIDNQATEELLNLREQYSSLFDDKKTVKQSIWQKIAVEMNEKGYYVGVNKDGAEKCRQKFSNLQKTYSNFISHCNKTGRESKEPPPFFERLHSILSCKHKFNPVMLVDSFDRNNNSFSNQRLEETETSSSYNTQEETSTNKCNEIDSDIEQSEENVELRNRFNGTKKYVRPRKENAMLDTIKTMNENVLKLINEKYDKLMEQQNQLMERQNQLILQQNNQRDRLINLFGEMVTHLKDK